MGGLRGGDPQNDEQIEVLRMGLPLMEKYGLASHGKGWACFSWKTLVDFRIIFVAYLEAPNSIIIKNKTHQRLL